MKFLFNPGKKRTPAEKTAVIKAAMVEYRYQKLMWQKLETYYRMNNYGFIFSRN